MTEKKKKGRIRQTPTAFQKAFAPYPGMIQSFSWQERLPEFLHISIALLENDYETVKRDFRRIADFINAKVVLNRKFHFNFSHTIKLIEEDKAILNEIFQTSFKTAFEQLLLYYKQILKIEIEANLNIKYLFAGYKQILDGRANTSILCKYLMIQYDHIGRQDAFGLYNLNTTEEILELRNVSKVMCIFPPSIGLSENLDLELCEHIWIYNYTYSPRMLMTKENKEDEHHFKEMKVEELTSEYKELYSEFKKINLLAVRPSLIAETNMGFIARINNLSLETVDLVKADKGEIAEMVSRMTLETFIIASWLLKKQDGVHYRRFRDFSIGRQKFFGEKIVAKATSEEMKKAGEKMVDDTIKEAGVRADDVATERGDIFDLNIGKMADEVWGENNEYYIIYKRLSEVVHGQWRAIAKYHLAKSKNPMNNGLYWYDENPKFFADLTPAFMCLQMSVEFLSSILKDINTEQLNELNKKLEDLYKKIHEQYMHYLTTYIIPAVIGTGDE